MSDWNTNIKSSSAVQAWCWRPCSPVVSPLMTPPHHSLWRRCGAEPLSLSTSPLLLLLLLLLASPSVTTFNISVFDLRPAGKYWQSGSEWKTLCFCSAASEMSFPLPSEEVEHHGGARWWRMEDGGWRMEDIGTAAWGSGRLPGPPVNNSHFLSFVSPLYIHPTDCCRHQLSWLWTINSSLLSVLSLLQLQLWLNHEIQERAHKVTLTSA